MSNVEFSRRDLFNPKAYARFFVDARSINHSGDQMEEANDNLIEGVGELATIGAILTLAYKGSRDRLVTYDVDSLIKASDNPEFREKMDTINGFRKMLGDGSIILGNFNSRWTSAYEKSYTICVPHTTTHCNSKGICTSSTTITCTTYYYWDEPKNITSQGVDHRTIREWKTLFENQTAISERILKDSPTSFDLTNGEKQILYKEKTVDTGKQVLLASATYGTIGTLFMYYEELFTKFAEPYYDAPFIDSEQFKKRRTFFKLGASLLLSLGIRDIQLKFAEKNTKLYDEIKAGVQKIIGEIDIPPIDNFRRFFGTTPPELRAEMVRMRNSTAAALDSGYNGNRDYDWPDIKANLERTYAESSRALAEFDTYFSYNPETNECTIPNDLTNSTKFIWATKKIEDFAGSKSMHVNLRHLENGALFALGLGALALINEKVVFPSMDRVAEKIADPQ